MSLLPFGKLPPAKPRRFVPQDADLGDWPRIAPLFDLLEQRAPELKTADELQAWLLDWSELNAALDEEGSRRYIAMTCHTDNADAEKAYLHFVEHIEPQFKPRQFKLGANFSGASVARAIAAGTLLLFLTATQKCRSNCSARKMCRWKPKRPNFRSNTKN